MNYLERERPLSPQEREHKAASEFTDEETLRHYFDALRLEPEDFEETIILDVGAGSAQFAKWLKEHGAKNDVVSLEPEIEKLQEKEKSVGGLAEMLPFKDESFDLVLSHAAIPNNFTYESGKVSGKAASEADRKIYNALHEMIRVLKPGGEIRLAPVAFRRGRKVLSKILRENLQTLETENDVRVETIPMIEGNTRAYAKEGRKGKILSDDYLVIIKKKAAGAE